MMDGPQRVKCGMKIRGRKLYPHPAARPAGNRRTALQLAARTAKLGNNTSSRMCRFMNTLSSSAIVRVIRTLTGRGDMNPVASRGSRIFHIENCDVPKFFVVLRDGKNTSRRGFR